MFATGSVCSATRYQKTWNHLVQLSQLRKQLNNDETSSEFQKTSLQRFHQFKIITGK